MPLWLKCWTDIVVGQLEFEFTITFPFGLMPLGKGMNSLILPAIG